MGTALIEGGASFLPQVFYAVAALASNQDTYTVLSWGSRRLSWEGVGGLPREGVAGGWWWFGVLNCGLWAILGSWWCSSESAVPRELPYGPLGRWDGFATQII